MKPGEEYSSTPERYGKAKRVAGRIVRYGTTGIIGAGVGAAALGISQRLDNSTTEVADSFTKTACIEGDWERVPFGGITIYERTHGEPLAIPAGTDICVTDTEPTKVKGTETQTITIIDKNGTRYTGEKFLSPQDRQPLPQRSGK